MQSHRRHPRPVPCCAHLQADSSHLELNWALKLPALQLYSFSIDLTCLQACARAFQLAPAYKRRQDRALAARTPHHDASGWDCKCKWYLSANPDIDVLAIPARTAALEVPRSPEALRHRRVSAEHAVRLLGQLCGSRRELLGVHGVAALLQGQVSEVDAYVARSPARGGFDARRSESALLLPPRDPKSFPVRAIREQPIRYRKVTMRFNSFHLATGLCPEPLAAR